MANLQDQTEKDETEPGSINTSGSREGQLLDRVSLDLPSLSESNVTHADTHPGEDGGKTRKSQEPIEDLPTVSRDVDVGDRTKDQNGEDRGKRSTGLVDVGEDPGSVTSLGKSGQSSRT
jgi:hypothetical protein